MGKNDTGTAIYGGSFDPPHTGHREVIAKALTLPHIDKIIIVPSWLNPFKETSHAPAQKRYEWCQKVFEDIEGVEISDFEISQKSPVYTIETYRELNRKYPVSSVIIGADNLRSIEKWRDFDKLNRSVEWIIAKRNGYAIVTPTLRSFKIIETDIPVSSSDIREGTGAEYIDDKIADEVAEIYGL